MKFSVLMSVYKNTNPDYFEQAVKSVTELQTITPDELVIVEDGPISSEVTRRIEEVIQKSTIKIIRYKFPVNVGLGVALAKGVELSTNDVIARMDDDDISVPTRFQKQISIFENDEVDIVGGQLEEFREEVTNIVGSRRVPERDLDIKKFAGLRSPFNHPTVMFKKEAVLAAGNYGDVRGLEDYDLWLRLISKDFRLKNSNETLLYMRTTENLYRRRSGFLYVIRYIQLKFRGYKLGVVSFDQIILSSFAMSVSVLMPNNIRKILYDKILHKRNEF